MAGVDKILEQMRNAPQNVRFAELVKVCKSFFGDPRQEGTSHKVFKTPWPGDPRVNIQEAKGGKAKAYQVKQVLQAIDKLEIQSKEEKAKEAKEETEKEKKKEK